jgi:hypothetical protein
MDDEKEEMMIARHGVERIVAAPSLEQEIKGLREEIATIRTALKLTRWMFWGVFAAGSLALGFYAVMKWQTLLWIAHRLLGF